MTTHVPMVAAERLIKLLGMLGSDHDGEVLTAARMADRLVRDQLGLTWSEVLQPPSTTSSRNPPRIWREPVTWQEAALLVTAWPECLTDWELGFLVSVVRFPRVSEKQLAILDRIVRKARGTAGVREPADPTAWHPPAEPPAPPDPAGSPSEAEPTDHPVDTEPKPRPRRKRRSKKEK